MDGQTIFAVVIGAALACFSLFMVGYSFFRGDSSRSPSDGTAVEHRGDSPELAALFDSIDTLELEYQLGNVLEEQYHELLRSYRVQVAVAVKALMEQDDVSPEFILEREVLEARSAHGTRWRSCPRCDAPLPVFDDGQAPLTRCPHCEGALEDELMAPPEGPSHSQLPAREQDR